MKNELERLFKVLVVDYFTALFCCVSGGAVKKHEKPELGYLRLGRSYEPVLSCVRIRIITLSIVLIVSSG